MADVVLPSMGESVEEGTLTLWLKSVGDIVTENEALFEISTDKVDSEVPAPFSGVLTELVVGEGETVKVGQVVARMTSAASVASVEGAEVPPTSTSVPPLVTESKSSVPINQSNQITESKPVREDTAVIQISASPLVRKIARESGVDLHAVPSTGAGGRITRQDIEKVIGKTERTVNPSMFSSATSTEIGSDTGGTTSAQAADQSTTAGLAETSTREVGSTEVALTKIRKLTGDHMVRSVATSPHAMTAVEVWYDNVDKVRRRVADTFKKEEGFSLTYLPFIARATVNALEEFPFMNASVTDEGITLHKNINLGFAVDLNFNGLVAPVVKQAEDMRLFGLAKNIRDLADRARTKKLLADDLVGGTFTISNSGSYGTHMVIPIINQPQVAILSTDGISRKPVVVNVDGSESIAVRSVGILAMSWDHRAFDGAYAAAFLKRLKEIIETRDWSIEI